MRELSHQISVCAAAWPGGQQDGWEQPLAGDILWTHREERGEGWGVERESDGDGQSCSLLNVVTYEVYVVEKTKEEKGKREERIRKKRKRKQRKREKTRGMKRLEEEITLN